MRKDTFERKEKKKGSGRKERKSMMKRRWEERETKRRGNWSKGDDGKMEEKWEKQRTEITRTKIKQRDSKKL